MAFLQHREVRHKHCLVCNFQNNVKLNPLQNHLVCLKECLLKYYFHLEILLHQGLNRQIRKMLAYLGYEVVSLKRVQHATLNLDGLRRGEFRPIKPKQIKELRNFLNRIAAKNA